MKTESRTVVRRKRGRETEMRKKGEWIYTGKRSQDLRDVTAKIRAIELFNPDGLRHPFPHCLLCEPPVFPCLSRLSVRLPFTPSPSNSPSGLLPLSLVSLRSLFFSVAAYFFCLAFRPRSGPALSLSSSAATPVRTHPSFTLSLHPPALLSPCLTCSLFCHDALVLAFPLYLPPPVVPSSLKAVESNR